jgi:hypothetical protein
MLTGHPLLFSFFKAGKRGTLYPSFEERSLPFEKGRTGGIWGKAIFPPGLDHLLEQGEIPDWEKFSPSAAANCNRIGLDYGFDLIGSMKRGKKIL